MTNEPQLVFGISGTLLLHVPRNSTGTAHPNEFIIKMKRKDLEKVKRRRAWDVVSLIFPPYFVPAYPTNHSFPTGNLCKRQPSKAIHSIMKTVHQLHLLWEGLNFKRGMHSLYKSLRSHWWGSAVKEQTLTFAPWTWCLEACLPTLCFHPWSLKFSLAAHTSRFLPGDPLFACSYIKTKTHYCMGSETNVSIQNSIIC